MTEDINNLIVSLIDMCVQYLGSLGDDTLCNHDCMSAGENAMDILVKLGYAKEIDGNHFKIDYKNLKQ